MLKILLSSKILSTRQGLSTKYFPIARTIKIKTYWLLIINQHRWYK
jgi:hypothetical protein